MKGKTLSRTKAVHEALQRFCADIQAKFSASYETWPEDQLKAPLDNLLTQVGVAFGTPVIVNSEAPQRAQDGTEKSEGRVDAAVRVNNVLTGHIELKRPGLGADPSKLKGEHNKRQWEKFKRLPNLIYTDGREWSLQREGVRWRKLVRFSGSPVTDGAGAVSEADAKAIEVMLEQFFGWDPIVPRTSKGIADVLAPLCRMMRAEAAIALDDRQSALSKLAMEWRRYLFPNASDDVIADAYAQTFTYALLIARFEGATLLAKTQDEDQALIGNAEIMLAAEHSLLGEVLGLLSAPKAFSDVKTSATTLLRVIAAIDPSKITNKKNENPWLYFYEEFLTSYDPALRKMVGAYYTPVEVVTAQVNLVRSLLVEKLGAAQGFADPKIVTLDPAVGTGTYPLGVLETVVDNISAKAKGSLPALLRQAASNLYGFEYLIGPYAVAHLRLSRMLAENGVTLSEQKNVLKILLADTLDSHETVDQGVLSFAYEEITREREHAREVKADQRVVVCLGNPPYRRGTAKDLETGESSGGWVTVRRAAVKGQKIIDPISRRKVADKGELGIIEDFFEPARKAGNGGDLKNAYNAYVYFWRWALWKVFEQQLDDNAADSGVISFITASSYLRGPGFVGMREHMRKLLDELWIIDLGGDNKGARKSENVFQIETPVAIAVGVRYGPPNPSEPATVHYTNLIDMSASEKKRILAEVADFDHDAFEWKTCLTGWQDPLLPSDNAAYLACPLLTDLFPWQAGGPQIKRSWPIGEEPGVLEERWRRLLAPLEPAELSGNKKIDDQRLLDRKKMQFKETRDRKVTNEYPSLSDGSRCEAISGLPKSTACSPIVRYAYRSLDRQWIIADNRIGDYMRASLWSAHSDRQVYLTGLLTKELGHGPALTASADIPDLDHFSNRGGRDVIPLWRDPDCTESNITKGLLDTLSKQLKRDVAAEDLFAYCYGLMATPAYVERYWDELTIPGPRVPITKNDELFNKVAALGAELIYLHTYGERYLSEGATVGSVPEGTAEYTIGIPSDEYPAEFSYDEATETISVGKGRYTKVLKEVWEYNVSGFKPVKSWLDYRKLKRAGKSGGSPLDSIRPRAWPDADGTEFLTLLWIVEHTIGKHGYATDLLDEVANSKIFTAAELPQLTAAQVQVSVEELRNPESLSTDGDDR